MKEIGLFAFFGLPIAIVCGIVIPVVGWIVLVLWLLLMGFVGLLFLIEMVFQLFPASPQQPPPIPDRLKTPEQLEWEQTADDTLAQLEEVDELLAEGAPEHLKERERALRAADREELREYITT